MNTSYQIQDIRAYYVLTIFFLYFLSFACTYIKEHGNHFEKNFPLSLDHEAQI